jgi:hypothetical protein
MLYFNQKTPYEAQHPILTRTYDSIGEAALAEALDICWTDGYLINVEPQVRFPLFESFRKVCDHVPDFLLTFPNHSQQVREFKGNYEEQQAYKRWLEKLILWQQNYPHIPYFTVKEGYRRRHTLYSVEQILGYSPPPKIYIPDPPPSKVPLLLAKTIHRIGERILG